MKDGKFLTLGIESSCDETAAAVVADGRTVYSNIISSQIDIHKMYGGVVPEIASRHHLENISTVIGRALQEAKTDIGEIDLIGVTKGPGLVGALIIGVAAAKALSFAKDIPLVGVHHLQGHISANYIAAPGLNPPFTAVVVSGGNTDIIDVRDCSMISFFWGLREMMRQEKRWTKSPVFWDSDIRAVRRSTLWQKKVTLTHMNSKEYFSRREAMISVSAASRQGC